jgi:hypothetical protein
MSIGGALWFIRGKASRFKRCKCGKPLLAKAETNRHDCSKVAMILTKDEVSPNRSAFSNELELASLS